MKLTRVQEINSRGRANGWHAQQLARRAFHTTRTMASLFNETVKGNSAFNVPAECIKVTASLITYRFNDGSESAYVNTKGK